MTFTPFEVPSSDGIHTLRGEVCLPEGAPKGFYHIVHGMTEHIARYHRFMERLAEEGYIAFGYDHLGHGKTAENDSELGFIAKRDGYDLLARDVKVFSDKVRETYDKEGTLPYYLMGHSMGSFVVRLALERYVTPHKCILMGTAGNNPLAGMGLAVISLIKCFRGERHVSSFVENLAFGSYNKRFGGGTKEDPSPWLTTLDEERNKYYADKFCTFHFTVSAMGDLIRLIQLTNRKAWYQKIPHTIPILLVAGEEDPVGNYGNGVKEVHEGLLKEGIASTCILYAGARHEILNDTTYPKVAEDILSFLMS